jgi:DNA-binding beta-propeller fold protein YncE
MAASLAPVALVLLIMSGCGAQFPLPTEIRVPGGPPGNGVYQRIDTWIGMDGITDLVLIPGPQLFLLFGTVGGQTGRVVEYKTTAGDALPTTFVGAMYPTALAVGGNRMFVLDKGDTAAARTAADTCQYTADCGPITTTFSRPITDVSKYWHLREYLLDGTLVSTFTDTSFASVNGVAADASGNVYISGVVIVCSVYEFDNRIRTMDFKSSIRRYQRGTGGSYTIGPWHRDTNWEVIQGTGIGSTRNPQGLFWANQGGESVYFADAGNNEVQKYDPLSLLNSFKLVWGGIGADSLLLSHPSDVSVDKSGYVYLVDEGNHRVLRYDSEGNYVQRVDVEPSVGGDYLVAPIAVAADVDQVYVADPGSGVVARFRRRK